MGRIVVVYGKPYCAELQVLVSSFSGEGGGGGSYVVCRPTLDTVQGLAMFKLYNCKLIIPSEIGTMSWICCCKSIARIWVSN